MQMAKDKWKDWKECEFGSGSPRIVGFLSTPMAGLTEPPFPAVSWPAPAGSVRVHCGHCGPQGKITHYTVRRPERPKVSLQNMPSHARWMWKYSATQVAPRQERSIKK